MLHAGDHILDYVDPYLHDVLPMDDAEYVAQHAEQCPLCRVALEEARKRAGALRSLPAAEASLQLLAQTERRLDTAIRKSRRLPNRIAERLTPGRVLLLTAAAAALAEVHSLRAAMSAPFSSAARSKVMPSSRAGSGTTSPWTCSRATPPSGKMFRRTWVKRRPEVTLNECLASPVTRARGTIARHPPAPGSAVSSSGEGYPLAECPSAEQACG